MNDLSTQFGLKPSVIEKIRGVLREYPQIEQVLLYGSRAKGNYRQGSDIDLTIKGDQLTPALLMEMENKLDDLLLPYKIDLSLFHSIENKELIAHIDHVGLVFFQSIRHNQ